MKKKKKDGQFVCPISDDPSLFPAVAVFYLYVLHFRATVHMH